MKRALSSISSSSSSSCSSKRQRDAKREEHAMIAELRSRWSAETRNRSEQQLVKMKQYMRNQFGMYGLMAPARQAIERDVFKVHKMRNVNELVDVVDAMWRNDEREFQQAAIALMRCKDYAHWMTAADSSSDDSGAHVDAILALIRRCVATKSWWDTVDFLSTSLLGALVRRHRALLDTAVDKWIDDDDMWVRRSALLCQLKWKSDTDERRLFRYVRQRCHENEFFIRKASGWALREYSKTAPDAVRAFVRDNDTQLSTLTKIEALKYIDRKKK
jgi:3-methyladenine DNA glycosylase AlkD